MNLKILETKKITVGVISDGKYGNRAFKNISKVFKAEWILVPEIPTTVMLDDDLDINIPECDLYISYVRHPDVIIQLAELQKPLILGVLPGEGLYNQAHQINSNVIHARTMCSLENDTGISVIDEFTSIFGKPIFETIVTSDGVIRDVKVKRSSLCGSSDAGSKFITSKVLNVENLQNFALSVCHECRAPRFGRTCDKEVAGIIHLLALIDSVPKGSGFCLNDELTNFLSNTMIEYNRRKSF